MLGKKIIISVSILSLFFAVLLLARSDDNKTAANLSLGSGKAEVVQSRESLDVKSDSRGAVDGISDSKTNQNLAATQEHASLLDKAAVEPKATQAGELASQTASANTAATSGSAVSRSSSRRVLTMVATAYDGCYECNKPYYGQPSYIGLPLARGIVAVDPQVIPMGTRLYVEGYGEAIAADQGNAIKGNRIDLFFDTHQQALDYGKKTVKVTIL